MKTQHTVAPWHVGVRMAPGQIFDAAGTCVADCSPYVTEAEARANAEHIVRCVNAHDALMQALQKIIEINRQQAVDEFGDADRAENWSCVKVCRAALVQVQP